MFIISERGSWEKIAVLGRSSLESNSYNLYMVHNWRQIVPVIISVIVLIHGSIVQMPRAFSGLVDFENLRPILYSCDILRLLDDLLFFLLRLTFIPPVAPVQVERCHFRDVPDVVVDGRTRAQLPAWAKRKALIDSCMPFKNPEDLTF